MPGDFFTSGELSDLYESVGSSAALMRADAVLKRGHVLLDELGLVAQGQIITDNPTVRYQADQWPAVQVGDTFAIGTGLWRVSQGPQRMQDGEEMFVTVGKAR